MLVSVGAPRLLFAIMRAWGILAVAVLLTSCTSSVSGDKYKTLTCKQWLALANASDSITNGSLDVASAYLNSASISPRGGASDIADFADTISGVCGPTRLADTKIIDLQSQIVNVFLSVHPEDTP